MKLSSAELPWPLTIWGGVGTGKTCAALAICDHVKGSIYRTEAEHSSMIRRVQRGELSWYNEGNGGRVTEEMLWAEYRRAPLVVLDEIGARSLVSEARYDAFYDLLECRANSPLIVITNASLEQVATAYDERITSRLIVGTVVKLIGPDRRDPRNKTP